MLEDRSRRVGTYGGSGRYDVRFPQTAISALVYFTKPMGSVTKGFIAIFADSSGERILKIDRPLLKPKVA